MSAMNQLFDLQEEICYVQCGFCTTVLLVSVPYSSMSMVVTVRCGNCTSLLSVNMLKASFAPLHLYASLNQDDQELQANVEVSHEEVEESQKGLEKKCPSPAISSDDDEDVLPVNPVVNKPPEKRQRAPSAYNNFIKEEIKRLKTKNPTMTHKEAFSAAAKNWAHFPSTHQLKRDGDDQSCGHGAKKMTRSSSSDAEEVMIPQ